MTSRQKLIKRVIKAFLPIILVVVVAVAAVTVWIVNVIPKPPRAAYLVTPQTFSRVTGPMLKATEVAWTNHDGTQARGWLIRGGEGSPSVVLLHRYGADRSWLLNLSVKLNETTNFTVLWPDLRGHGPDPPVKWSSFGTSEPDDVSAAIAYLRSLKTVGGGAQVGDAIGLYGVELGAYAVLAAAGTHAEVRALVLDSVPSAPDDLLNAATRNRMGIDNGLLRELARLGARIYFLGKYKNPQACQLAASLQNKRVLLLSGEDAGDLRASTVELQRCFTTQIVIETKTDLALTGLNLPSATGQLGEGYDRRVIEFFDKALR